MPKVQLTDRFCATAKPLAVQTDFFDKTVSGLALRVTKGGHRAWTFIYTSPRDGKRARASLGTYPATSLAAARGKAIEARAQVETGHDPRLVMAGQASAGMTVGALVVAYLADPEKAELRSIAEVERRFRRNVVPVIGAVKLSELRRRDVRNVVDPIMRRGRKVEAARVFEDIRGMVRWAVQRDFLDANPIDGMDKPTAPPPRDRVLSDDEIRKLWTGLPTALARSVQCQRIIKLCLVTAQRVGEVTGMVPEELDFAGREWRIPGARTKNAHAHVVPLSKLAIEIIREAMAEVGEGQPLFGLPPAAVARTILRAHEASEDRQISRFGIAPWSAHDLRRTALTGMARLGVAPIVLGHVANHRTTTKATVTLAVYSQYTYDTEKRAALDLWAERLSAIVSGSAAEVIPMRGAR